MEHRLGHDFATVRIHTDARAAASASVLGARAYTSGNKIVFATGAYAPNSPSGQRLLAHELVHVVQHRTAPASGGARVTSHVEHPAERQADDLARRMTGRLTLEPWRPLAPDARLSLVPAMWYRGEVEGVPAAKDVSTGRGVVHDLGEGKYFSDSVEAAKEYSEIRAHGKATAVRRVIGGQIDPAKLGKVLDLTKDPAFMRHFEFTKKGLPRGVSGEPYRNIFENYLKQKRMKIEDFKIIIGPEGVRSGKQMCVRDPAVLQKLMVSMTPIKPGGAGPAGGSEPLVGPGRRKPPGGAPSMPSATPGKGARIAIGAGKLFGPMILHSVNQYFMAKEEAERAHRQMVEKLESPEIGGKVSDLIEKQRLDIARKQYRGRTVYATVKLKLTFVNGVLDDFSVRIIALGGVNDNSFMSAVMSHDPIIGIETKVWWVTSSAPVPPVPLSESEDRRLRIELLDEEAATTSMDPSAAAQMSDERNRLVAELRHAEKAEEEERKAEIRRPSVIADPKKRAQQQTEISEQLRKLAQKKKAPTEAKKESTSAQSGSSLVPTPAAPQLSLLPGALGEGPIEQAARVVKSAAAWSERLARTGSALESRLQSNDPPTVKERQAFFNEELSWRLAIKYAMNVFENRSRREAVNALAELLDRYGPKLNQFRIHLGG
jgi:Domain of unknown function (DUF4157)